MSNEPSKRIERLLRKWARTRRDAAGAGWPVHPATRRLLQGEVARTLAARSAARAVTGDGAGAGAGRGWLALFWPRLAWGGVGLALIALVWMALPRLSNKPGEMAAVDSKAPLAVEPMADRTFNNYAGEPALPPAGLASAPSPTPTPVPLPVLSATPTATRQTAALADERTQVLVTKREVEADAELAAVAKATKAIIASGAAPVPERAAGGGGAAGAAGAGSQALLELAKQSGTKPAEAKFAAEKGELLERRNDDLAPADRAIRVKDLADRDGDRLKGMANLNRETLGVASISAPTAAPKPTAPKPTASQPTVAAARSETAGSVAGRIPAPAPAGPMPVTATAPANALSLAGGKKPQPGIAASSLLREESPTAAAAPTAPAGPDAPIASGGAGEGVAQQNFVRLNAPESYRRNLQSPPSPALLQQFQIQRSGNVVTVVDEDGSVYQGKVIAAETAMDRANRRLPEMQRKSDMAPTADKAVEKKVGQAVNQAAPVTTALTDSNSFWFRATGTNRSLNQRVVFTGEFQSRVGNPDAPVAEELAKRAALRADLIATNSLQYGFQQRASGAAAAGRILGRAQIGANSEIQVEAVSSTPPRR